MVDASLRQGMEGERVELGEAPSERTHTFAWSGELRRIGREGGREGEREKEREREEREREKERERSKNINSIYMYAINHKHAVCTSHNDSN